MIVCHTHKFIFFRPRKVASASVKRALASLCEDIDLVTRHHHRPPDQILDYEYVTQKQFETYRKVTIARNPWDREVSMWWHKRGGLREHTIDTARKDFQKWASGRLTREYFLEQLDRYAFSDAGHGKAPIYTNIIRFEHLQEDLAMFSETLNLPVPELPHAHGKMRKLQNPYQDYYTSEIRNLIANKCAKYIKHFSYTF